MVSEFVVVWVELNWLRDVAGSAFFVGKGTHMKGTPGLRRGLASRLPGISSPPAESGDRQHTPHGLAFQGGRDRMAARELGL